MLGTYALSAGYYDAYYLKAQKVRTLIKQDFDQAFEQVDVIVGPTSPSVAFKIGEKVDDPLQMYLADVFTLAQALAGFLCFFTALTSSPLGSLMRRDSLPQVSSLSYRDVWSDSPFHSGGSSRTPVRECEAALSGELNRFRQFLHSPLVAQCR